MSIAIIGAGLAGLAAAATLHQSGQSVTVFDKGRGPGGRCATRRLGEVPGFDHGLPWLTPALAQALPSLPLFASTAPPLHRLTSPAVSVSLDHDPALWPGPGMRALAEALARRLSLHQGHTVTALQQRPDGWHVESTAADGTEALQGPFARLILALPAPQACALLAPGTALHDALSQVVYAPCWTLMLGIEEPPPTPLPLVANTDRDPARLWRIIPEALKPGRPARAITIQADAAWTEAHLEQRPGDIAQPLRAWAAAHMPDPPLARWLREAPAPNSHAHRWRYSRCVRPAGGPGQAWLSAPDRSLFVIGDSVTGASAAKAALSGTALARHLLREGVRSG